MADPKPLTRDQLAKFLPDAEAIKRFERLFQVAGDLTPADVAILYRLSQEASLDANTAIATANQALSLLGPIVQDAAVNAGAADEKAVQALDWLNRIAASLEWLTYAPATREDNSLLIDYIDVSTTAPTAVGGIAGRLTWNDTDGTLDLGLKGGNVTLQIGQENVLRVKNDEATQLNDGEVVYIYGASGANLLVRRALANSDLTSANTIGIVTEAIAVNGQGFITTFGQVRGLDTSAFNEGDILYLSPTTPGAITNVKPVAPDHMVLVGYCVKKSAGNGEIFTKVDNGYELDELHNVLITAVADKNLLQYDAAGGYWKNVAPSAVSIGTATNVAGGSAGSIPYQTAANTTAMLAIGTAAQVLQVNAGATAPEWVSSTGTGNVVRATSPTLVTPTLGAATATSINKVTITAPATSATLTIANGKTLTASNSLTFAGTDGTTLTFPSTSATIARTDAAQSFTGAQTFNNGGVFNYVNGVKIDSGGTTLGQLYYSGGLILNRLSGTSLLIQQNNSSEMVFTSNGDVQIGSTTGATYRLFVYKADNSWATFFVRQDGTADIAQFAGNGGQVKMAITRTGNIYGTAGSTGMTDGFFYIPAAGGAPTGAPTAVSGTVPMYYDTTNNKFYVYNGAWKSVTLT